jgi:phospholipid transport system transporter-binding protein
VTASATAAAARSGVQSAGVLRDDGDGRYRLEGAVTLATVTDLRRAGVRAFAHAPGAIEVDLSGVGRADSGGLALLVDWLAWARAAHRVLKFTAPPAALLALARLSDVEDLLLGSQASSRAEA